MATQSEAVRRGTQVCRFDTQESVIRALVRFDEDSTYSSSVLSIAKGGRRRAADAYGIGFLRRLEEHEELVRRMWRLTERDRLLLVLWYSQGWPVTQIATRLNISRVHCYRLRDRALASILEPSHEGPSAS